MGSWLFMHSTLGRMSICPRARCTASSIFLKNKTKGRGLHLVQDFGAG